MLKTWFRLMVAAITITWSAVISAATITPGDLFAWVERDFPSGFPSGQVTRRVAYPVGGPLYDYRFYAPDGGIYIAIGVADEHVYTIKVRDFVAGRTDLVDQGHLDIFKCYARPPLCGAGTAGFAGTVTFSSTGGTNGTNLVIGPNYKDGNLITWVGYRNAEGQGVGVEVRLSDVEWSCFRSDRLGNWGVRGGVGCKTPEANGTLRVDIPNNACGRVTLILKTGLEVWLNFDDPQGWRFTGLNARTSTCGIEYGPNGFQPNRISAVLEPDNSTSIILDFNANHVGGFYAPNGGAALVLNPQQVLGFFLHGSKAGPNHGHGWGLGVNRDNAGNLIPNSIRFGWLVYENDRYIVKIRNVACADRGHITVHSGSGPSSNVVYAPGPAPKGMGLGSIGFPGTDGVSVWTAGSNVTLHKDGSYQFSYATSPFCRLQ